MLFNLQNQLICALFHCNQNKAGMAKWIKCCEWVVLRAVNLMIFKDACLDVSI